MRHKTKRKPALKNILSRILIKYFAENVNESTINYEVTYNEKGVFLTSVVSQFISIDNLNSLEENAQRKSKRRKLSERQSKNMDLDGSAESDGVEDVSDLEDNFRCKNQLSDLEVNLCNILLNSQSANLDEEADNNTEDEEKLKETDGSIEDENLKEEESEHEENLADEDTESEHEENFTDEDTESEHEVNLADEVTESEHEENLADEDTESEESAESIKEVEESAESIKEEEESAESIEEDDDIVPIYKSIKGGPKDFISAGILPLISSDNEEEGLETFDTQTLNLLKKTPVDLILQDHINNLRVKYKIPDPETDDSDFFRTVTEDTVGYIKDLYESKLLEIFNKLNGINEKKIDLMQLLKKSYGKFFFSTAGTSLLIFNRLDMPFVSAWQEYLEYFVEMDCLEMKDTLKGFFRFAK